jgi:hypothetical protein
MPWPIDLKFAMHEAIRPCSRALLNAGSKMAISRDMTEMTTSNSINVNADTLRCFIALASLNSFIGYYSRSGVQASLERTNSTSLYHQYCLKKAKTRNNHRS